MALLRETVHMAPAVQPIVLEMVLRLTREAGLGPLERLRAIWPALVSKELGRRSHPTSLRGKQLVVSAATPGIAQELQLASSQIVRAVGPLLEDWDLPHFDRLVVHVAPEGTFPPAPSRPDLAAPPPAPPEPSVQRALDDIEDPEMRSILSRLVLGSSER